MELSLRDADQDSFLLVETNRSTGSKRRLTRMAQMVQMWSSRPSASASARPNLRVQMSGRVRDTVVRALSSKLQAPSSRLLALSFSSSSSLKGQQLGRARAQSRAQVAADCPPQTARCSRRSCGAQLSFPVLVCGAQLCFWPFVNGRQHLSMFLRLF